MKGRVTFPARRSLLVVIAVLALVALLVVGATAGRPGTSDYEQDLRSRVDTTAGAPKAGHDPAAQRQVGLAAVARSPHGTGLRGGRPARAVQGRRLRRPARLADPKRTGVLSSGCALGYGANGAQCVPAHRPGGRPMTCAYLIRQFPAGIAVTKRDVLALDTNRDRLACGPGDRGVSRGSRPVRPG